MERLWRSKTNYQAKKTVKQLAKPQLQTETQLITKNQNVPKQQEQLLLPNQIGCRIIEMEMEIMETQNLTKEIILSLIHQYSKAIQFYEERGSQKHMLYQKKMQGFLHKPAINQILNGKTGILLVKKKAHTESQFYVKKLMENSKQVTQKQQQIVKKQLQSQQKNLEERLQRKRTNSNRVQKGGKITSASFSVPTKANDKQDQDILISQFVDLEVPNKTKQGSNRKNVGKVFI